MHFLNLLLLITASLANVRLFTSKDYTYREGDMTVRSPTGAILYFVHSNSFSKGHRFEVMNAYTKAIVVKSDQFNSWNPKTWVKAHHQVQYVDQAGGIRGAIIKMKWIIDNRKFRTFDVLLDSGEVLTAKG